MVVFHVVTSSFGLLVERGCICHSFIPGSWSAWIAPVQALLLLDDVLVGPTRLARKTSQFTLHCLGYSYDELLDYLMQTARYRVH